MPERRWNSKSVFDLEKMSTGPRLPNRKEVEIPQFEKGEEYEKAAEQGLPAVPKFRTRERLAKDLTDKENDLFSRNSVNRIWFLLMGRGLFHPLDQMHVKNSPSHPKLLELLAGEFVSHGFDLKWLLREIMLSETYQRSSRLPEGVTKVEPASYRVTSPKGLTPEQLLRAVLRATGNTAHARALKVDPEAEKFDRKGYFTGSNVELPPSLAEMEAIFIQTFAQPPGVAEVDFSPGVNKSLFPHERPLDPTLAETSGRKPDRSFEQNGCSRCHGQGNVSCRIVAPAGKGGGNLDRRLSCPE